MGGLTLPGALVVCLAVWPTVSAAVRGSNAARGGPSGNPLAAIVDTSEEAGTLLQRSAEAIQREDWKVAVDSLQRIIELPGEHLLTSDQRVYESARLHAHRRISTLPPQGLEAYRLVYDGEAAALLERARRDHDVELLRRIVDRYLLTRSGDEATTLLADWLMDEGEFSEAAALLRQLGQVYPDSDLPAWIVPSRLAACSAAMGHKERAEASIEDLVRISASQPALSVADGLPLSERIDRIKRYIASPSGKATVLRTGAWPMALGDATRHGVMPTVEPTLLDHLPWSLNLPVSEPRQGMAALVEFARERQMTPTRQLVTDGHILLVKGDRDLVAMDIDSFDVLWRSSQGGPARADATDSTPGIEDQIQQLQQAGWVVNSSGGNPGQNPLENDPAMHRLLRDSVSSGVVIGHGLALTVNWPREAPAPIQAEFIRGNQGFFNPYGGFTPSTSNTISAYSLKDGSLVWKTAPELKLESPIRPPPQPAQPAQPGPGNRAAQPLGGVEFLACPIPVNDKLVSICRLNTDLYATVLDPKNGELVRHVYLCATGGGLFDSLHALDPCMADGVVYLPTGRGLLVAMDAVNWSIRWAVRYDHLAPEPIIGAWLPTPPVAVADVVLLTPGDANYLICLDRGSGQIRWSINREDCRYLLGATNTHAWMAGKEVYLVDIEKGRVVWKKEIGPTTGRGVLTEKELLLPAPNGLLVMNAMTGDIRRIEQPVGELPLGNLLSWDSALYSVSLQEVRKYPDLAGGYQRALARHQADPTEPSPAVRLAWLETLRHEPRKALEALSKLPENLKLTDPQQYTQVAHLKVRAMLDLASTNQTSDEEALSFLEQARRLAESAEDAIATALALGDYHKARKHPFEACIQYLSLVTSEQGDQLAAAGGGTELRARGMAIQRIADTQTELSAEERSRFEQRIDAWLEEAAQRHDRVGLNRLIQFGQLGRAAARAELLLGTWAAQDLQFEQAETLFLGALNRADTAELQAEAAARLAAVYLEPDEMHQPVSAMRLLDRLAHEFAAIKLPAAVTQAVAPPSSESLTGAQLAERLHRRLKLESLREHQQAMAAVQLGAPGMPRSEAIPGSRPLSVRGERSEPLADLLLSLADSTRLNVHNARSGEELWSAELRLLGEQAVDTTQSPDLLRAQGNMPVRQTAYQRARGVLGGEILLVNTAYGLHAVGLRTGRRLWSRPFSPPFVESQSTDPAGYDAWLGANNGYVVAVDARRRIEVARIHQGERILWRAAMPQRQWHYVRARGNYVVAADAALAQIDVFRQEDGRHLGEGRFTQRSDRLINISLFTDLVCGPVSEVEIAALELATPGVERWRVSMADKLSQVFKPSEDLLVAADMSGRIKLIDPANGKEQLSKTIGVCRDGVIDGAINQGVLYLCGYQKRVQNTAQQFDEQRWGLAAIELKSGNMLWELGDLPARVLQGGWGDLMASCGNAIPVVAFSPATADQPQQPVQNLPANPGSRQAVVELTLIDRLTGKPIGRKVSAPITEDPAADRILDVQIWPEQVVATAGSVRVWFPCPLDGSRAVPSSGDDAARNK